MLLMNKNAVIYGGGGAIGGAVARAFAREGAKVFLAPPLNRSVRRQRYSLCGSVCPDNLDQKTQHKGEEQ